MNCRRRQSPAVGVITVKLEVGQNDLAATGVAEDRHVVEVECAEKSVEVLGQRVIVVAALWFVGLAMTTGIEGNHPELIAQSLKLILIATPHDQVPGNITSTRPAPASQ